MQRQYSLFLLEFWRVGVDMKSYIKPMLPATTEQYWYFTAYTGVFFIAPLINACVQKLDNTVLRKYGMDIVVLFSVCTTFSGVLEDTFYLKGGYCFSWLALLYFLGAVIKKTQLFINISVKKGWLLILALVLVSEGWKIYGGYITLAIIGRFVGEKILVNYSSPAFSVCFVIVSVVIDYLRRKMFKVLKVNTLAKKIEKLFVAL